MKQTLVTTPQAAEYLGNLKPNTLEGWRIRGEGPKYRKIGRLVRYSVADLDEYVTAQTRQSTSQLAAEHIQPVRTITKAKQSKKPTASSINKAIKMYMPEMIDRLDTFKFQASRAGDYDGTELDDLINAAIRKARKVLNDGAGDAIWFRNKSDECAHDDNCGDAPDILLDISELLERGAQ